MNKAVMLASGLALMAGSAYAGDYNFDHVSCYSGPAHMIQHTEDLMGGSYEVIGMTQEKEGSPEYNMTGRCVGMFTLIKGAWNEGGSCEFVNPNGDKYFGVYERKGDPAKTEGTWKVLNGTGVFAGMTGDTKWIPVTDFPPIPNVASSCNHEHGTYHMK